MKKITNEEVKNRAMDYSLFTWSVQNKLKTIAIKNGKGCYFWDYEGKKYFDLCSQLICVNIGHGNEHVIDSISKQLQEMEYVKPKFTTRVRGDAAELIIKRFAPSNMGKVLFSLGGAESNEYAIKLAKEFTGKTKIFSQYNSYHGSTYGAANLTGEVDRSSAEPQIAGFIHYFGPNDEFPELKFDNESDKTEFYLDLLERQIVYENPKKIAALFLEPISGGNGIIVPPKGYIKGVYEICKKYDILFIVDEVLTGFGRTGETFAINHFDIEPDMITFAKGITSAYVPLGGVILSRKISEYFNENGVPIGCTYNSHPISMAAAKANLEVILENRLIENCNVMGEYLAQKLELLVKNHISVHERRGLGLLQGVKMNERLCNRKALNVLFKRFVELGYPTNGNQGIVVFAPPLIVTKKEIDEICETSNIVFTEMDTMLINLKNDADGR